MPSILIAIPTRNRAKMVREVLEYESLYYAKYHVTIGYYDSSDKNDTKQELDLLVRKYGINIFCKRINARLCLDYKIIEMFKDFEKMSYDYYWLINDSISISEDMLKYVYDLMEKKYDLIRLPLAGSGRQTDYITNDINDWFHNCSQGMAHMASTVMSRSLLNAEHNWEVLKKKYIHNNVLDNYHGYFFTVGFYLEQISKMKKFKGIFIGNKIKWRRDSPLKKNQIYWKNYVFEAWAKSYPETIMSIPDVYTNKIRVIMKSDNISVGRFSKSMLIHYRLNGLYDIVKYGMYRKYFKYVTEETEEVCYKIAAIPIDLLKNKYPQLISLEDEWEKNLNVIEKLVADHQIVIYGAGLYGGKVIGKLIRDGFSRNVNKVIVTNYKENVELLYGVPVYGLDKYVPYNNDYIIICALPKCAEEMKNELEKRNIRKYVALFDV